MLSAAVLAVACTGPSGNTHKFGDGTEADNQSDDAAIEPEIDEADLAAGIDEVVKMQPGGFAELPGTNPGAWEVTGGRHVLRSVGSEGPIDMFDLVVRPEGTGLQRCVAASYNTGAGVREPKLRQFPSVVPRPVAQSVNGITSADRTWLRRHRA